LRITIRLNQVRCNEIRRNRLRTPMHVNISRIPLDPTELIRRSTVLFYTRERSGNVIMTAKTVSRENSNRIKNPDDWVTGDEEMTGAQESYLQTLADEAHERVEPDLTKAEASKEIDRLRVKTGRGRRLAAKPASKASRRGSPEPG
jgi:Protein of unknown function (DUF3072)